MIYQANHGPIASALGGWSERGHGNLAQRLAHALREQIVAGLIEAGTRLPPERQLASTLAVSRSTVTAALDELRGEGLVESRRGAGTVVLGSADGDADVGHRMADYLVAGSGGVDLAVGNPFDVAHLPPQTLDVADLMASGAGGGFHPLGLPALRRALADRHTDRGVLTEPDEIHVTGGAHQAISMLAGAFVRRGGTVATAVPGYPGFFDITDGRALRVEAIETDRGGLRPESLDRVLTESRPELVYVQHGPHNPTGIVPSTARRRAVAKVLDDHDGVLVVEDSTVAPLTFAGEPDLQLAQLCRRATVVSVCSVSKVLWAGLRVGWLRGPRPVIERTLRRQLETDLGTSIPSQLLCLGWLPHFDEIAAVRRAFLRDQVERASAQLTAMLPEWTFQPPGGSSAIWVDTGLVDVAPLVNLARRFGVHIASGVISMPGTPPSGHLRLCVDRPWPIVEAGLDRLAAAWQEHQRRPLQAAN